MVEPTIRESAVTTLPREKILMELFLIRHADAIDGTGNDYSRTLSEKGRKQAEKMGDWLKEMKTDCLRIVTSPFPRAHETANIIAARLENATPVQPDERLAPGMATDVGSGLIHEFGKSAERLALVGHAPDLGNLASYLIGARENGIEMRKGAVACLECVRSGFGGSVLKWLIDPKL